MAKTKQNGQQIAKTVCMKTLSVMGTEVIFFKFSLLGM